MTDADLERLLALDGSPGPALALDPVDADALIEAALAGAGFGPAGGGGGGGGGGGAGGATGAGAKLAVAMLAVVAAVAIVLFLRRGHGDSEQVVIAPIDAAVPDAAVGGSGTPAIAVDATMPIDSPEETPPPKEPRKPAAPQPSAADLLGEANAKRAAKQWRESDTLYAKVVERAPKSLAAQSALISSASLHLEHLGDPKGAAQRFRRALAIAPSGALAEDARWGIAEAARATGDRKAEAAALDAFLAHHAGSPLAARAAARRAELP